MAHAAPPGDPVQIDLREWTRLACGLPTKNSFVEGAVDLSWAIAKHLCRTRVAPSAGIRLEDCIAADAVLIFVERPAVEQSDIVRAPSIADIKFQFEVSSGAISRPSDDDLSLLSRTDRRVHLALGKILLEIFSMGNSSSLEITGGATKNNYDVGSAENDRPPEASLPAKKRLMASPARDSMSTQAKNFLLSLGIPLSICQLVCDLLDPGEGSRSTSALKSLEDILDDKDKTCMASAVTSVDEVMWDLMQMKASPQTFLFDRSCPQRALEDACIMNNTHDHLVGRESEMSVLMTVKNQVSLHVRSEVNNTGSVSIHGSKFRRDAIFLSGYAGSGKSSILNAVTNACNEDKWLVLGCKFDKQSAPHTILAKAFDEFFGKWGAANYDVHSALDPAMVLAFNKVCGHILDTLDNEGLRNLADFMPNFAKSFPLLSLARNSHSLDGISSMDKVGSGKKRLQNMFHVLLDSLCSVGRPVLFTLDDLQWSNSSVTKDVADFVVNYVHYSSGGADRLGRRGLLIAGTYRSNEVKEGDDLVKSIDIMKKSGRVNVTMLTPGKLSDVDLAKMVSAKLCLPWRHTRGLATLVHAKTRGNPFFVVQFLRSIVQNKMLSFSVKRRRWVWDCDTIELQTVSEGVAELLAASFSQLSPTLMLTLKVVSCLGSQVEESTIDALDSSNEVLSFNMQSQLPLAVHEGILEKAGPIYQFTHDIIQSNIYETISPHNQKLLHKTIGENLLKLSANNPTMRLLAVDQVNMFCKDGNPNAEERSLFSESNATAAKLALASSSFDQARLYIAMGIRLLENDHWKTRYSLSLDLFEMSASVSFVNGDTDKMSACLDAISAHAKSFDDLLKASSLLVKLLTSSSKYEQARRNCLMVLSNLGEVFPQDVCPPLVLNELTSMRTTLRGISANQLKLLPPMADRNKLNVMKFFNMLCMCSLFSKPLLLPLAGCRMVKLTMEFGFCEDSIVGLATVALSVFHITDDVQLASHLGEVCESLIEESPRKHLLRARLCHELATSLKVINEPVQSTIARLPGLYNSAMLAGDSENAMICRSLYCGQSFYTGGLDIASASKALQMCVKEAGEYQQTSALHSAMILLNVCLYLSGEEDNIKSFEELIQIGERTSSELLLWQVFMSQVTIHLWFREYIDVVELSEKHAAKYPSSQQKRSLHFFRSFYEGIAYLSLARDTKQVKWKIQGEKSVVWMRQMESMSKWNFENKSKLLQAELHYLEGDIASAESFYEASIESARNHRFIQEEALACELYGVCCIENKMVDKGSKHLRVALEKYKQWGAMKKASELELFIGAVDHASNAISLRWGS